MEKLGQEYRRRASPVQCHIPIPFRDRGMNLLNTTFLTSARSPSVRPLTSARTALLPPRNTSCPLTATLVPGISAASFGSTPAPRSRVLALWLPLLDSALPTASSGDSSAPSSPPRLPVSVRRFSLAPSPRLVAIPYSSSLSFPIWPPVETSRLGDISIVVTSPKGDISNVAAWGHYQSRATEKSPRVQGRPTRPELQVLPAGVAAN